MQDFNRHLAKLQAANSPMKLIIFQGYIYNISDYMYYHPGGFDRIEPHLGKDIDMIFKQVGHTVSALKVIAQLPKIGKMEGAEKIHQDSLSPKLKEPFMFDMSKGIWWQMMNTQWNLDQYNNYLDSPKVLINPWRSVKLFDNPIAELITMGPWQQTPIACLPCVFYFLSQAQTSIDESIVLFIFGMFMWSFFEYNLHRHLFHAERSWMPDHPWVIACHFVLNGIHHAYP